MNNTQAHLQASAELNLVKQEEKSYYELYSHLLPLSEKLEPKLEDSVDLTPKVKL